ncbi:MAG: hypothetical protein BIFFINMI_01635 [Phycisphaerae bacterium]|nr:hypothetical protein [Phycisphaerae bacterium]
MELPRRTRGDELLKPGELTALRSRLRQMAPQHDLTSVIACAFDHRTRMLPFIYADLRMAPAGVRAIGSAMYDAGFEKTRIVLQQWNRNFRPSRMKLDGRVPDLFMVSSMQIHGAECKKLIRDACRIEPARRPLIIAGGPKTIYEPWDVFSPDPNDRWGADVAVTGEEFVLLGLMEALLQLRHTGEPIRTTFLRARNSGLLDGIPGLVYAPGSTDGVAEELVDTGIQRLVGDLDETPHPVHGYRLLEPPSRGETLASRALDASRVNKFSPIGSLVLTFGCKFACPYCPIPAYNQRQHRLKSPQRISDEMTRLHSEYGIRFFFGTDDNFFNNHERAIEICTELLRTRVYDRRRGRPRQRFRWGTEVTVHDTLKMGHENLKLARKSGVRGLWLGVEDMTATLIKKGQSEDKTAQAFRMLKRVGILPMPMMMHFDDQPLVSFADKPYGLINQVRLLRKAGAISLQVLMISPATGSKLYEECFTSGLAYNTVAGKTIEPHMLDANFVIASRHPRPWIKQANIMAAYLYFYNPLRAMQALVWPKSKLYLADFTMQIIGMWGVSQTIRRTFGWMTRLMRGQRYITRKSKPPVGTIPMRSVQGDLAAHALPGAPHPQLIQLDLTALRPAAGADSGK